MIPNLSGQQYEYLRSNLSKESDAIFGRFLAAEAGQNLLDVDEDTLCLVRDWIGRELLRVGFCKDIQFTAKGEYLAEIIDLIIRMMPGYYEEGTICNPLISATVSSAKLFPITYVKRNVSINLMNFNDGQ